MRHDARRESSRAATNRLLFDMRTRRWRLAEVTALHGLFLFVGGRGRWRWVAASWTLSALHLGMLEDRSHLGSAKVLTLVRANLPVTGSALGHWLAFSAMLTDFVDGKLARHTDTATPFGRYADPLADAAFWMWLTLTDTADGSRIRRALVVLIWFHPSSA